MTTDSDTVQRLKELGIQKGDGCKNTCRCTARSLLNLSDDDGNHQFNDTSMDFDEIDRSAIDVSGQQ